MNRPRKHDRHLPAAMYHRHGAYYLVRHGKWMRLGADLPSALREYARRLGQTAGGMPALIDTMLPRILRDKRTGKPKASETQRQYRICADMLRTMLAEFDVEHLTARDIKAVRRELQDTPAVANRALTVLKLILEQAVEDELIPANPAVGVDRIPQTPRTRRITVREYQAIRANADPLLRAVMAVCYATGQRIGDVLAIRSEDITDEGVYFEQQKTGKQLVVAWTTELRAAVAEARALKPNALRPPLLWGFEAPTYAMVWKRWKKACKAARVTGATLHDLRAMAATDAEAQGIDARALLGHTDERTTRIYLRDKVVPVVSGPVMKRSA
jgi:integrase